MQRLLPLSLLVLLIAASAYQPAVAQDKPRAKGLDVQEFTLDNGLKVVVVNRPGVPVVSTFVWYKVGSMDEVGGATGMAHFLEHMMFKGSRNYKVGEVDNVCVRNGGSNNAFTSYDYTGYYIDLPKSRYTEALKIEADRMRHLTLDLKEFESEKKVVQSESDIFADDPGDQLWTRMTAMLHGPHHPYAHPVLGWPQDVADISRRDMRLFYDKHYHPNHATLVLAGDVTADEVKPTITQLLGAIPRGPELKRPEPRAIDFKGPKTLEVKSDSEVIQMGREYLTVQAGHPDVVPLQVLGLILGGGVTSRLYRALVDESGLATSAGSGHGDNMLSGSFWMWAELSAEHSREDLVAAIQKTIDVLIEKGVTAGEVERARNRLLASFIFGQEQASSIASSLGESETVQGDWRAVLAMPDKIRAVTAADVQRVAAQYLKLDRSVTGWLVPELSPVDTGAKADDAKPQPLPVKRHVLGNGLRVLMLERPGLPVVTATASIRSGRASETAAENGLSSFTGSLLDTGTKSWSKQELAEAIENIGASLSVGTDGGTVRMLSEHTPLGIRMLAEVMIHPTFPAEELELLRRQTLASIESEKDETASFARSSANAALYGPDNPLGRPAQGSETTVAAFNREQTAAWHAKWFRPDNCIISVVGDFDAAAMLKLLEGEFGAWQKPSSALSFPAYKFERPAKLEGEQAFHFKSFDPAKVDPKRKRIAIDHPGKDQVVVRLQTLGITRDNPDYFALMVMDNVLGTSPGFTDRFSKVLRDEMGLAYSAYANIANGSGIYPGAFLGYIGTRPENVELALQTMYRLLEEIRTTPVSDDELTTAKDYLKGSFVFDVETTSQLAGLLVSMERYNLGADYLVKFVQGIDAVTKADVQRVAKKYLVPEQMVEVICGPITKITPAPEETEDK
ncbi:MAG: insulinase family protein [Planctomycetes bacterium]|nr:insulinase family protein [Planctomycetota bacterium]